MSEERFAESAGRQYKLMTLPDFRRFRDLATNADPSWTQHYSDNKLSVESKPPGDQSTSLNIIRAKRIMPRVPPRVLYDQLHDASYRATWDNNMVEGYNIVVLDSHNDVGYYSAKFPWPLSDRDFCNQRSWMEFDNGEYVIFNHSEPHADCPVKKNFIRAKSFLTGYYIQPYDDGKGTKLTYVTHSDPCGSIPKSVINFVMTKGAPRLLDMCEKCSEEYPEFAAKTYSADHVFPWTTPKMNWDSTYLYPEDIPSEPVEEDVPDKLIEGEQSGNFVSDKRREKAPSLVPLISLSDGDPLVMQQYRVMMQEALDGVDRSFLCEDKVPTARQYLLRLKGSLEGIQQTL